MPHHDLLQGKWFYEPSLGVEADLLLEEEVYRELLPRSLLSSWTKRNVDGPPCPLAGLRHA